MKRFIVTEIAIYDRTGKWLGKEVKEMDGFTKDELQHKPRCYECGAYNGAHREYYVKTGQDACGGVEGHYEECKTGKNLVKLYK